MSVKLRILEKLTSTQRTPSTSHPMFDISAELSARFCKRRFPHYASFAHLPLYVTVVVSIKNSEVRRWYYNTSEASHEWTDDCKASMENFISQLSFDDHDFFTIDDYQLFLPMNGPTRPLVHDQIEQDREELLAELAKSVNMTKEHVESMLKAVEFWKLRYDTKYQEWMDKVDNAMGYNPPNPNEVDEGYSSD